MTKILAAALFAILVGTLAVHAKPPAVVVASPPGQPWLDIPLPPPEAPFDETVITPVETVGASPTD